MRMLSGKWGPTSSRTKTCPASLGTSRPRYVEALCALRRLVGVALTVVFLGAFCGAGNAHAEALSKVLETHLPEIVQWVYRTGAVETSHPCEEVCKGLWTALGSAPPKVVALDELHQLESGLPLWGTDEELQKAFNAATRFLGKGPLRVGWWAVNGVTPASSKWIELVGPADPHCGAESSVTLKDPGEEVGDTFFEHAFSSGEDFYLRCPERIGLITAQQITEPTTGVCGEQGPPPNFPGFYRQEWWWNKCGEGGGYFAKVFADAYYFPLHVVAVQDWEGQHLEGEGTVNIQTFSGTDPGVTAVTEATKTALEAGPWLREYLEWVLEGKLGPNPSAATPEESFGSGNAATPDESRCMTGHPVDCATGNQTETQQDLAVGGRGPELGLTRTYNSQLAAAQSSPGPFGYGWTSSFSAHIAVNTERASATVFNDNGSEVRFAKAGGAWVALNSLVEATLASEGSGFVYTLPDQTVLRFNSSGQLTAESDRNGNTLTMTHGGTGRLEAVTDEAGRKLTLAYNAEGQVESVKDPMGHVAKYSYEAGQLKSVTEPGEVGPRWQFEYDASHELTKETDGRGHAILTEYDAGHRVIFQSDALSRQRKWSYEGTTTTPKTTITEPNGSKTVEEFNEQGEPTSVTRAVGTAVASTTLASYDEAGRVERQTDPDGHSTAYTYDPAGDRSGETDPLGDARSWTYDSMHDVISTTTPRGETTLIERDVHGNAVKVSRPAPGAVSQVTKFKYDAHGDLESITDPLERTRKFEYDGHGDRTGETDPEGDKQTWGYNEDSQEISAVSPRGHVAGAKESKFTTAIERDARGRVIKVTAPLKHETKYAYDADGNLESVTDPEANVTSYTYDADDEPTKVKEPNGASTETEYDAEGRVVAQVDGDKHTTKYARDALEQVIEVTDPLARKTTNGYDAAGNLTSLLDAAKRTTTYKYDAANRLTEVSYSDGKTPTVQYEYDADGERTKMVDGTGTSKYTYDQLDRLTEAKDGHGDASSYEYDLANERTKITYPGGKAVTRAYDNAGRLKSLTDWLEHTSKFAYDADSDLTATVFPSATGDEDTYAYDEADQMSEVKMAKGAESLASLVYTRNKDSGVTKATTKGLPGEEKPAFAYDENSRLTKGAGTPYKYDAASNPTTIGSETYSYDAASELEKSVLKKATVATYSYDEVGERTKVSPAAGPATTYGYDEAGNLTSVKRSHEGEVPAIEDAYAYDGDDLRASQTISGTTSYMSWDATEGLPLLIGDGTSSFVYGPGGLPVEQIAGETVQYLHHDQQGSTRLLTGASGTVAGTITFDAYGNKLGSTGSATTALGYDGQYTSPDTGLIYLRARVYDPRTGQFISSDPALAISGAPYGYAAANPVNREDAFGLIWTPVAGGAGGADAACGATIEVPGVDIGTCGAAGIATGAAVVGAGISLANSIAGEEPGDEGAEAVKENEAEETECDAAGRIAGGHAFEKHAGELGLETREGFEQEIKDVIERATREKRLSNGRTAYYDPESNTLVIVDPASPDGGTVFKPSGGEGYFNDSLH
jgi:RHS repeat-associated protein